MLEQHGSTRSTRSSRLARHVQRVESCRDVTSQVEFGLNLVTTACCFVVGLWLGLESGLRFDLVSDWLVVMH